MTTQVRAIRDFVTAGKPLWLYRWTGASRRNDSIDDDERGESDERISEAGAPIVADAEASPAAPKAALQLGLDALDAALADAISRDKQPVIDAQATGQIIGTGQRGPNPNDDGARQY